MLFFLNYNEEKEEIDYSNLFFDIDKIIINNTIKNKEILDSCLDKINESIPKLKNSELKGKIIYTNHKTYEDFKESSKIEINNKKVIYAYICDILIKSVVYSALFVLILTSTFIIYFFISNPSKVGGELIELSTSPELLNFIKSLSDMLPKGVSNIYSLIQSSLINESSKTMYIFLPMIIYLSALLSFIELFFFVEIFRLFFGRKLKSKLGDLDYMNNEFYEIYDKIHKINKKLA